MVAPAANSQQIFAGSSVTYAWPWYYHVPSLGLWTLLIVLLLGRRANRTWQAWAVLIPLGLVVACWRIPPALLGVGEENLEPFAIFFLTLAMDLAVLWLLGDWLARRRWWLRLPAAIGLVVLVHFLSCLGHFDYPWSSGLNSLMMTGVGGLVVAVALALTGVSCRGIYGPVRVPLWSILWISLVMGGVLFGFACVMLLWNGNGGDSWVEILLSVLVGSQMAGLLLDVVCLPFVILAVKCPLYRERLCNCLQLQTAPNNDAGTSPFGATA